MFARTAPDLSETVTTAIRHHRRRLEGDSSYASYFPRQELAGRYTALAGATVDVDLRIKFTEKLGWGEPDVHTVQFSVTAQCNGHGCTEPDHEQPLTKTFPLGADADETAKAALPPVTAARKWAQAHAEKCRAKPYDGR